MALLVWNIHRSGVAGPQIEIQPGAANQPPPGDTFTLVKPEQALGMQFARSGNSVIVTYADGTAALAGCYGNDGSLPSLVLTTHDGTIAVTQESDHGVVNRRSSAPAEYSITAAMRREGATIPGLTPPDVHISTSVSDIQNGATITGDN